MICLDNHYGEIHGEKAGRPNINYYGVDLII